MEHSYSSIYNPYYSRLVVNRINAKDYNILPTGTIIYINAPCDLATEAVLEFFTQAPNTKLLLPDQITSIAELNLKNEIKVLRDRLLITYFTRMWCTHSMSVSGKEIVDGWLHTFDYSGTPNIVPLHPLLLQLFESYHNNMPTIRSKSRDLEKITKDAGIMECSLDSYLFVYSTIPNMILSGFTGKQAYLITHPYPAYLPELKADIEELFKSPFYEPLYYLQL